MGWKITPDNATASISQDGVVTVGPNTGGRIDYTVTYEEGSYCGQYEFSQEGGSSPTPPGPGCNNTGTCEIQIVNETPYTYNLSKHSDDSIAVIYVGDTGYYGTRLFPPNNNTITINSNSTYPSSSSFLTVSYNVCGDEPESKCCAKNFKVNLNSCTRMNKLYEGGTSIYDLDGRKGYTFIEPASGTPNYFTQGGKYILTIKTSCS